MWLETVLHWSPGSDIGRDMADLFAEAGKSIERACGGGISEKCTARCASHGRSHAFGSIDHTIWGHSLLSMACQCDGLGGFCDDRFAPTSTLGKREVRGQISK